MSTKKKTPWYVLEASDKRPTKPKSISTAAKTKMALTNGKNKASSSSKAFLEEISHSVKEILQEKNHPAGAVTPTTNFHLNAFISYKQESNTQYLFIIKKEDETTTAAVIDFDTGKIKRLPYLPLSFKEGYRVAQNEIGQQAIMDAWMSDFIVPFGDYKLKLESQGTSVKVLATVGNQITQFDLKPAAKEMEEKYSSLADFNLALQEAVKNKPSTTPDLEKEEKVQITFIAETDYTILCSATMGDETGKAHLDLMSMELNPLPYQKVYPAVGGYRVAINDKKEQGVITANGMETKVHFVPCSLALFESKGEIEVIAIIGNKTTSFPLENLESSGPSIKDKYDGPEDFLRAIEALPI